MSSYNLFASFYDELTENVDYKVRSEYISGFFLANGVNSGTILDLACGTCSMSAELAEKGYNIVGIDSSQEMLTVAENKLCAKGIKHTLINAKMQDFTLTDSVDGCICCLDSINHITDYNDVEKTFKNVYKSLKVGGVFVFDVNTSYKHNNILADNTFVFDEDNYYLVWDNEICDDNTVRIILDFFIPQNNLYSRYSEEFYEKAYESSVLKKSLTDCGFNVLGVYDELTKNSENPNSERLYFVCKKGDTNE